MMNYRRVPRRGPGGLDGRAAGPWQFRAQRLNRPGPGREFPLSCMAGAVVRARHGISPVSRPPAYIRYFKK